MRLMLIAALVATMYGQEAAKMEAPKGTAAQSAPTERHLTENEVLKLKLSQAQIQLLQKDYKIEEYQSKLKPLSEEQVSIAKSACLSVGVPEAKILLGSPENECGINMGVGPDGNPVMGPDGKPQVARVWWARPAEPEKKK